MLLVVVVVVVVVVLMMMIDCHAVESWRYSQFSLPRDSISVLTATFQVNLG